MRPSRLLLGLAMVAVMACPGEASVKDAVDIGTRVEMLVDDWLVEMTDGLSLRLTQPERREIVWQAEEPWEDTWCAYFTVLRDGGKIRLYYRASMPGRDLSEYQYTCVAESSDGIRFTRPKLGLVEFEGSRETNIIWKGALSHNFAPFVDTNPDAKPEERYKAIASMAGNPTRPGRLYAFASPDGIHWKQRGEESLDITGAFDSLNVAFWDPAAKLYRSYSRIFADGYRAIQSCTSPDMVNWTKPVPNAYPEGTPAMQLYTNATVPCPGAEHILLSFPKRLYEERTRLKDGIGPGVSDAILMSSRDGEHWDRTFLGAWLRPGLDPLNWSHRNNMPAWGIIQTSPDEFSLYASEHAGFETTRLRRLVIRRHGFASMHADGRGGEFVTRPIRFGGDDLVLNFSTSASGSIRVEVQDETGKAVPGFTLQDAPQLFGDALDEAYRWKDGARLGLLKGKTVRLRFVMQDADLYAIRTGQPEP